MAKERLPAMQGWMRWDEPGPRLLGTRCADCGSIFFPREDFFCRNPECAGTELEELALGTRGRLWSYTNSCYPPPKPYVAPDPFEPLTLAAVELEEEKLVVLGQVVPGVDVADLEPGMQMELVVDTLFEKDDREYLIWKWKPAG